MIDTYEKVKCTKERPEYILKNGKSINVYGMLKDVHLMQGEIAELCEVVKKMRQSHANLIELRALPNSGWYGEAQDLVDLCDSALAKHQSS